MKTLNFQLFGILIILFSINTVGIGQGLNTTHDKLGLIPAETTTTTISTNATKQIQKYLSKNLDYPSELLELEIREIAMVKIKLDKHGNIISKSVIGKIARPFEDSIYRSFENLTKVDPVFINGVASDYSILVPISFEQ